VHTELLRQNTVIAPCFQNNTKSVPTHPVLYVAYIFKKKLFLARLEAEAT